MEVERLGTHGWFQRDGFAGQERALEALSLARAQTYAPAAIHRSQELDAAVRSDQTAWLDASPLHEHFEALRVHLNCTAYLGLTRFDVQLARYDAGAHYVRHRDAFPGADNRRVTAIAYLNDGWQAAHGGVLRLHVNPPVDIEPHLDRLIVFLSDRVEHEVLPARAPRYAMTAWYYGPNV